MINDFAIFILILYRKQQECSITFRGLQTLFGQALVKIVSDIGLEAATINGITTTLCQFRCALPNWDLRCTIVRERN